MCACETSVCERASAYMIATVDVFVCSLYVCLDAASVYVFAASASLCIYVCNSTCVKPWCELCEQRV